MKNIDVSIPKNKLVVITGLSGSGKSSLAFDTIYAEGQRRYVESLSSYARQFLSHPDKSEVDSITGLSPAIAIDQRPGSRNPRSTVGTLTEIYDRLRILFARLGQPHCPGCGQILSATAKGQIFKRIIKELNQAEVFIMAPVLINQSGDPRYVLSELAKRGLTNFRIDGRFYAGQAADNLTLDKNKKQAIEVIVAKLIVPAGIKTKVIAKSGRGRGQTDHDQLAAGLKTAMELGNGTVIVYNTINRRDYFFSTDLICPACHAHFGPLEPRLFSFNSPHGACVQCKGLGVKLDLDPNLVVPNPKLTIAEGAIRPWSRLNSSLGSSQLKIISRLGQKYDFTLNIPWNKLTHSQRHIILYGTVNEHYILSGAENQQKTGGVKTGHGKVEIILLEEPEIPQISVSPDPLDFGDVEINSSKDLDFTVKNIGTGTLSGSVTGLSDPFSCLSGCSYNLSANAEQAVTIRFSPLTADNFNQTANFSGGGGESRQVLGEGTGSGPGPAPVAGNIYDYAWSWGCVGNVDVDKKKCENDEESGIGWISFNGSNYGVGIDADGRFSGYAWSSNIGWITFNETELGGCPAGNCRAEVNLDNGNVSGWARAYRPINPEGQTLGGWTGWISLRGSN